METKKDLITEVNDGMDYLKEMFDATSDNPRSMDKLDGTFFRVKGEKDVYELSITLLHYCFAKGRINAKECLSMMKIS